MPSTFPILLLVLLLYPYQFRSARQFPNLTNKVNIAYQRYSGQHEHGPQASRHKAVPTTIVWHPMNDVLPANPKQRSSGCFLHSPGSENIRLPLPDRQGSSKVLY